MGFIGNLFGNKGKKPLKKQPQSTSFQQIYYGIVRYDKTMLEIMPIINPDGSQKTQKVWADGKMYTLYCYMVKSEGKIKQGSKTLLCFDAYLHISFDQILQDPSIQIAVANVLLPQDELEEVYSKYHGYAGDLTSDINRRYMNQSIPNALKILKQPPTSSTNPQKNPQDMQTTKSFEK